MFVQAPDHLQRECTLALHHLVHAAAAAHHPDRCPRVESLLLEPKSNRVNRVGRVDREMLPLLHFDQRREHVQPIALGGSLPGTP